MFGISGRSLANSLLAGLAMAIRPEVRYLLKFLFKRILSSSTADKLPRIEAEISFIYFLNHKMTKNKFQPTRAPNILYRIT